MDLVSKRVLITGGNGFIGGRLAERLILEEGARVRALVRRPATVREDSRLRHAEIVSGDVSEAGKVLDAVKSCDCVVHCAAMQGSRGSLDDFRRINVEGTLNVVRAAYSAGVARFVHISTVNVHGMPPPGANAESLLVLPGLPGARRSDSYSLSKAEGELAAREFARAHDMPLVVVRPACTYGPRSKAWTLQPLERVRRRAPVLIGKGDGVCNAVYIDNLVDLILLTLKKDAAVGNSFIGAEGRGVTWRQFYGAYAQMIGIQRLRSIPRRIALGLAWAADGMARVAGRPPRISRASVEFYSHHVVFDIAKSATILGYAPRVSFEEGMRRTEDWLQEVGSIPAKRQV